MIEVQSHTSTKRKSSVDTEEISELRRLRIRPYSEEDSVEKFYMSIGDKFLRLSRKTENAGFLRRWKRKKRRKLRRKAEKIDDKIDDLTRKGHQIRLELYNNS